MVSGLAKGTKISFSTAFVKFYKMSNLNKKLKNIDIQYL